MMIDETNYLKIKFLKDMEKLRFNHLSVTIYLFV